MKITGFETFIVPPRWLFLKIETDEGLSGWGSRWSKARHIRCRPQWKN